MRLLLVVMVALLKPYSLQAAPSGFLICLRIICRITQSGACDLSCSQPQGWEGVLYGNTYFSIHLLVFCVLLELMLFSLKIHTYCCKASFVTDISVMMQVVKYKENVFCVKVVELNDIYMSCHVPIYCTIGHFLIKWTSFYFRVHAYAYFEHILRSVGKHSCISTYVHKLIHICTHI
jgi:hypothetical protein